MSGWSKLLLAIYLLGDAATLIFLVFEDWPTFNWWNWLFIVPIDVFLATMWPVYWPIVRPLFG